MSRAAVRATRVAAFAAWLAAAAIVAAAPPPMQAPNVVVIDDRLVTAGQPTRAALQTLRRNGFDAVVYLAPSTVPDAIADEPALLAAQGIEFVHIPVPFDAPEAAHAQALSDALQRLQGRRVLVHCQVNMRASSLVFLHRVVALGQAPAAAYEAVAAVWSPRGPWQELLRTQLRRHGIDFEPY